MGSNYCSYSLLYLETSLRDRNRVDLFKLSGIRYRNRRITKMTNEQILILTHIITFIGGVVLGRVYKKRKRNPENKNYLSDMLK